MSIWKWDGRWLVDSIVAGLTAPAPLISSSFFHVSWPSFGDLCFRCSWGPCPGWVSIILNPDRVPNPAPNQRATHFFPLSDCITLGMTSRTNPVSILEFPLKGSPFPMKGGEAEVGGILPPRGAQTIRRESSPAETLQPWRQLCLEIAPKVLLFQRSWF